MGWRVSFESLTRGISIGFGLMREDRMVMLGILKVLVFVIVIYLPSSSQSGYGFYQISIMLSLRKEHATSTLIPLKFDASKGSSDHTLPMRMFRHPSNLRPMDMPRMRNLPRNVGIVICGLVVTIDGFVFVGRGGDVLRNIEIQNMLVISVLVGGTREAVFFGEEGASRKARRVGLQHIIFIGQRNIMGFRQGER